MPRSAAVVGPCPTQAAPHPWPQRYAPDRSGNVTAQHGFVSQGRRPPTWPAQPSATPQRRAHNQVRLSDQGHAVAGSDAWRVTISMGGQVQHPVSLRRAEHDIRRQLGRGIAVARVTRRYSCLRPPWLPSGAGRPSAAGSHLVLSRAWRMWMALAKCPARQGQQRSLRKMRQDLSWALTRSPGPPSRAWARLASFWEVACSVPGTGPGGGRRRGNLVAQDDQAGGSQGPDDAPDPGGDQVVDGAGQRPEDPYDVTARAGEDLQVHPVPAVLAGV